MGTVSKRPLRDFGVDVRPSFRTGISHRGRKATGKLALPASTPWLVLAGATFAGALALKAIGRNHLSLFVGQWVPTFLLIGLFAEQSAARSK